MAPCSVILQAPPFSHGLGSQDNSITIDDTNIILGYRKSVIEITKLQSIDLPEVVTLSFTGERPDHQPGGGTRIWFWRGCAADDAKPLPVFRGHFGRK